MMMMMWCPNCCETSYCKICPTQAGCKIICQVLLRLSESDYYVARFLHQRFITSTGLLVGLLLTRHVGLRWCRLMDGSPEVRCAQGDKQRREDTHPKAPRPHQERSWQVRAPLACLGPTKAPFCQSGRGRSRLKTQETLGSMQHLHLG